MFVVGSLTFCLLVSICAASESNSTLKVADGLKTSDTYLCNQCPYCDNRPHSYGGQFDFTCTYSKRLRYKLFAQIPSESGSWSPLCQTNFYLGCCPRGSSCRYEDLRNYDYLECTTSSNQEVCTGDKFCDDDHYLIGVIDACSSSQASYLFIFQGLGDIDSDHVFINIDESTNTLSYKTYDADLVGPTGPTPTEDKTNNLAFLDSVFCFKDNLEMQLGKETGLNNLCTTELREVCTVAGWPEAVITKAVKTAFNLFSKSCVASAAQDRAVGRIVGKLAAKYNLVQDLCNVVCSGVGSVFSSSTLLFTTVTAISVLLGLHLF